MPPAHEDFSWGHTCRERSFYCHLSPKGHASAGAYPEVRVNRKASVVGTSDIVIWRNGVKFGRNNRQYVQFSTVRLLSLPWYGTLPARPIPIIPILRSLYQRSSRCLTARHLEMV